MAPAVITVLGVVKSNPGGYPNFSRPSSRAGASSSKVSGDAAAAETLRLT